METRRITGVPPWWERYPAFFLREAESARRSGFRLRLERSEETPGPGRMVARGRVRVRATRPGEREQGHGYDVEVVYPESFPFDKPDVRPLDPSIRRRRHQLGSGDLCYTQEELAPWELGEGLDRALEDSRVWFRGEVTGHFDREVPATELLLYLEEQTSRVRALLVPGHAIWQTAPGRWGTLDIEWDGQPNGMAILGAHRLPKRPASVALQEEVRRTNDRLWKAVRGPARVTRVPGIWFSLEREPRPFRNLAELESVLVEAGGISPGTFRSLVEEQLGSEIRRGGWLPIGLEYPRERRESQDQGAAREWLFLTLEWPHLPERLGRARRLRSGVFWQHYAVLKGISSHPVRPEDLRRRVGNLYPADILEQAHVVIVGTGALGSPMRAPLPRSGSAGSPWWSRIR